MTITINPGFNPYISQPGLATRSPGQPGGKNFPADSTLQGPLRRQAAPLLNTLFTDADTLAAQPATQLAHFGDHREPALSGPLYDTARAQADELIGLRHDPAGFNVAIAGLSDAQLDALVEAALGETDAYIQSPRGRMTLPTVYKADRLVALQQAAEALGDYATQVRLLGRINGQIVQLPGDAQIMPAEAGESAEQIVRLSQIPGRAPSAEQIEAKQVQVAERAQRIETLRARGTPEALALADRLEAHYRAQELGVLADDVYHWADPTEGGEVPVGWQRASENPELLARFGIELSYLMPPESGFRAELYVPDPSVFGAEAEPVLVFKGTTATSAEDWSNNFAQGLGGQSDYYERAMKLATRLDRVTEGYIEFSGHSLGGGMASAAAAVTGEPAVTFNAAGLHENTARDYMRRHDLGTPHNTDVLVRAYQVDGDVLTTLQQSAGQIDPVRAAQLSAAVRFAAGVGDQPAIRRRLEERFGPIGDIGVFRYARSGDLLSMPEAAGQPVALAALGADGQPSAQPPARFVGPTGLATRIDYLLDRFDARWATTGDRQLGFNPMNMIAQAPKHAAVHLMLLEFSADPVLDDAGAALNESVARHGMDFVGRGIARTLGTLEAAAEQL